MGEQKITKDNQYRILHLYKMIVGYNSITPFAIS